MDKSSKVIVVLGLAVALSACKTSLTPDWETYYSNPGDSSVSQKNSHLEWLDSMAVDSWGDIISAGDIVDIPTDSRPRSNDVIVTKQDDSGNRLWSLRHDMAQGAYRSDDKVTDMVVDNDGNSYLTGVQYIVQSGVSRYGSFLMKVNRAGSLVWAESIGTEEDARDIDLNNGRLYVTGLSTKVFDLSGAPVLTINHPASQAWKVKADDAGNIYTAGYKSVTKYNASGTLIWTVDQPANQSRQADLVLQSSGQVVAATYDISTGVASVVGISGQGNTLWRKSFSQVKQSNGLPGPVILASDYRGDVVLSVSNEGGRKLVKLNDAGTTQWQVSSQNGIVESLFLSDAGNIYIAGAGNNDKYDASGSLLGDANTSASVQVTTGAVVVDRGNIYIGYSARQNSSYHLYLAKYTDQ